MKTREVADYDRAIDRAVWEATEPEGKTGGRFTSTTPRLTQEELEEIAESTPTPNDRSE